MHRGFSVFKNLRHMAEGCYKAAGPSSPVRMLIVFSISYIKIFPSLVLLYEVPFEPFRPVQQVLCLRRFRSLNVRTHCFPFDATV